MRVLIVLRWGGPGQVRNLIVAPVSIQVVDLPGCPGQRPQKWPCNQAVNSELSTINFDTSIAIGMQSSPGNTSISSSTPSLWTHLPALTSWWFQSIDWPRTGYHLNQWKRQQTCEDQSLPSAKAVGPVPGDSHQASDGHLWSHPVFRAKWLQSRSSVWMCHSARLVDESRNHVLQRWCLLLWSSSPNVFHVFAMQVQPGSMNHSFRVTAMWSMHSHLYAPPPCANSLAAPRKDCRRTWSRATVRPKHLWHCAPNLWEHWPMFLKVS